MTATDHNPTYLQSKIVTHTRSRNHTKDSIVRVITGCFNSAIEIQPSGGPLVQLRDLLVDILVGFC